MHAARHAATDGSAVGGVDGISGGEETDDAVTLDIGSGTYAFELTGQA